MKTCICRFDKHLDALIPHNAAADPAFTDPWLVIKVNGGETNLSEYYGLNGDKELFILEYFKKDNYYMIVEEIPAFLIESEVADLFG
jgi:hypothetical protein